MFSYPNSFPKVSNGLKRCAEISYTDYYHSIPDDLVALFPSKLQNAYIVNRGKWLGSPANIKGANKEAKVEVGRSMTVHIFCFALIHYA